MSSTLIENAGEESRLGTVDKPRLTLKGFGDKLFSSFRSGVLSPFVSELEVESTLLSMSSPSI